VLSGAWYVEGRRTSQRTTPTTSAKNSERPATHQPGRPARRAVLEGADSARADRADERHGVEAGHPDAGRRVLGVDDHAVADVHADVADRAVVEDEVTRLQLARRDVRAVAVLRAGRVREAHAGGTPRGHRQTGAVEGARAGGTVDV